MDGFRTLKVHRVDSVDIRRTVCLEELVLERCSRLREGGKILERVKIDIVLSPKYET